MRIEAIQTCGACPTQYEGTIEGERFYFRYRHGFWSVRFHPTDEWNDEAWVDGDNLGDDLDGCMGYADVMDILEKSYTKYKEESCLHT